MARSARRAAGGFRNIGRFETVVFLRPGCLDVSAQLAVSNILPLESPPRVSIAPLTVDLRLPSQRQEEGAQLTPASRSPKVSQQPVQGAPRRSEPCQYNGQWDSRFYAASIVSGSYARALSKRSKNSCMASAGTRSPMDSCGRQRLQYGSMNPIALCFVVDASERRSWWYHSFLGVPKNDSNALDAIMCRVGAGRQAEGHIGNPLST